MSLLLPMLALGALGGFLSGLLGIGGGIIFVPALVYFFQSTGVGAAHGMHLAVGTSMAVVLATSLTSALHHAKKDAVDKGILRRWGAYIIAGVAMGTFFTASVDGVLLKKIFAVLTALIAVYLGLFKEKVEEAPSRKVPPFVQHGCCVCIGAVSSMLGIGGALLNIPLMVYSGLPMARAVGTGVALGVVVALPGTAGYIFSGYPHTAELPAFSVGYVNLTAAALIIPSSVLLAPVGVKAAHLLPQGILRRIFSLVLFLVSWRMMGW